jgi:hypothetical protein
MHIAWGMRLIMHIACVIMFLSFCKLMPDDGSLNRNMQYWMTDIKVLCLTVIRHLYSM